MATVGVYADLAAAAGANVNFTARLVVGYFRQDPNLRRLQSAPGRERLPGARYHG